MPPACKQRGGPTFTAHRYPSHPPGVPLAPPLRAPPVPTGGSIGVTKAGGTPSGVCQNGTRCLALEQPAAPRRTSATPQPSAAATRGRLLSISVTLPRAAGPAILWPAPRLPNPLRPQALGLRPRLQAPDGMSLALRAGGSAAPRRAPIAHEPTTGPTGQAQGNGPTRFTSRADNNP
jgi:hypothetical protein